MPQIKGSLSSKVLEIVCHGPGRVAGMVIDEQGASHENTKEQMIMLRKLAVWRCPIFLVQLQTKSDRLAGRRPLPTKPELRLAACDDTPEDQAAVRWAELLAGVRVRPPAPPPNPTLQPALALREPIVPTQLQCRCVTKAHANALVGTDLAEQLWAAKITHVVIMGQQTNCCVRATAIGGQDFERGGPEYAGLVHHDFRVLSTPKLMSSQAPAANFWANAMVEIYSGM